LKGSATSPSYLSGERVIARWPWLPEVALTLSYTEATLIETYIGLAERLSIAGRATAVELERMAVV
jgi:hypothetical protein